MTTDITDKDFEEKVLKSDKPAFVDFWAPWCGPCKIAGPVIEELAEQYKDKINVFKLNVDENQETAQKHGVLSIPTVVLFKGGQEQDRQVGFAGKEGYEDLIKKVI